MKNNRLLLCLGIAGILTEGCMEQYDPRGHWQKFEDERHAAHVVPAQLSDKGELPKTVDSGNTKKLSAIDKKYNTLCASCHGEDGRGETPAGKALTPRPRNFTDKAWQASVDDAHIKTVILKGGPAVGLSASMVGWEMLLPGGQGDEMVKKVRTFGL